MIFTARVNGLNVPQIRDSRFFSFGLLSFSLAQTDAAALVVDVHFCHSDVKTNLRARL